jgi:hypothetical protein
MIGAIANPKKTFDIECDIKVLKKNLEHLPIMDTSNKYSLTEKNDVLSTFTFEATELLSLGVYIDVTLTSASETITKVEIEVRRKLGAFDKSHEVTSANQHLKKISTLVAECSTALLDDKKIEELRQKSVEAKAAKSKGCSKTVMWICVVFIAIVVIAYIVGVTGVLKK